MENKGSIPERQKCGSAKMARTRSSQVENKEWKPRSQSLSRPCPVHFFPPSLILQAPSLSLSLSLSPSSSLPLTHWRMLTHQVPWLPSMGWCHFRWHHHAVYVYLYPPPSPSSPHTSPPAALPLFLSSEGRCCLTHTRYTLTIGQTVVVARVQRETGAQDNEGSRHGLPGGYKHLHKEKCKLVFSAVVKKTQRGDGLWGAS